MQLECKAYNKARDRFCEKEKDEDDKSDDKDKLKHKGSAYYIRLINPYNEGSLS
jgi:hypothetical protein